MSAVAKVIVEVLKIPENSKHVPEIQNPNQKVDITESDTVGYIVALINAVDKDQDYLWYRIESKCHQLIDYYIITSSSLQSSSSSDFRQYLTSCNTTTSIKIKYVFLFH